MELRGPMELILYEGEPATLTCRASGRPAPTSLSWTVNRQPIDLTVDATEEGEDFLEQTATAEAAPRSWNGATLACDATQVDGEGNEVVGADERSVRVVKREAKAMGPQADMVPMSGVEFKIMDRYPSGSADTTPEMLVSPGVAVTFSCTSSLPWHVCRWKRPNSGKKLFA